MYCSGVSLCNHLIVTHTSYFRDVAIMLKQLPEFHTEGRNPLFNFWRERGRRRERGGRKGRGKGRGKGVIIPPDPSRRV